MMHESLKEFVGSTKSYLNREESMAVEMNAYALGITRSQLMESAGALSAEFIRARTQKGKSILVACGPGNNGGDGFVLARHLSRDYDVLVFLVAGEPSKPEALSNFRLLEKSGINVVRESKEGLALIKRSDAVVDAIFGIGFHGSPDIRSRAAISQINSSQATIFSIDIPSGMDISSNDDKHSVKADYTLTFHKKKIFINESRNSGKVSIINIGIPDYAELLTGPGNVYLATAERRVGVEKRENGRALIIGGSSGYHGAPSLASGAALNVISALRVGSGYVIAEVPDSILNLVRAVSPNLIARSCGSERISFTEEIKSEIRKADVIALGMGIGRDDDSMLNASMIIQYASSLGKNLIVDADAIHALKHVRAKLTKSILITPHHREFLALTGKDTSKMGLKERIKVVMAEAERLNINILLKGHETIISNGKLLKVNISESSALATMGTGDVLSGIISGYLSKRDDPFNAAAAGAYLHSRIGDMLAASKGTHIIAMDVVESIPKVIRDFDKNVE